jgi:hypothetical protein
VKGKDGIQYILLGDAEEELGDYAMQCSKMDLCIAALFRINEVSCDEDFLDKAASAAQGKQIFKGGIWDSYTKTVVPISHEFIFFQEN